MWELCGNSYGNYVSMRENIWYIICGYKYYDDVGLENIMIELYILICY